MRLISLLALSLAIVMPAQAMAWGSEGHEIIADIARDYLTPDVRAKVDALLATDTDTLTAPDMASRATWADAWRGAGHRETASWHFVDTELDKPDLQAACFGYPAAATPASAGPAQDCVVDKIEEFQAELSSARTAPPERVLALVYLLHFVGDLHQPLHNEDVSRGGNGIYVKWDGKEFNLHHVWDTSIAEKWIGGLRGKPYPLAQKWANQLAVEIADGKFAAEKEGWLKDLDFTDPNGTAMAWSREANAIVCTHGKQSSSQPPMSRLTYSCSSSSARGSAGNCRPGTRRRLLHQSRAGD